MDEFYRVPLSSAEALATLAALKALDDAIAAGLVETGIESGILESAAQRIAAEVPEFLADQAAALSGALARELRAGLSPGGGGAAVEAFPEEPPFPVGRTRRVLEDAFEQRRPVEIEYFVASRGEWTTRRLDISDVFERDGAWYVSGQCGLRAEYRQFRLDHVRGVRLLQEGDADACDPFRAE